MPIAARALKIGSATIRWKQIEDLKSLSPGERNLLEGIAEATRQSGSGGTSAGTTLGNAISNLISNSPNLDQD